MKRLWAIVLLILMAVAFGLAGSDDLQDRIDSAKETAEIKRLMRQRQSDETRDAEAYRSLFLNRVD